MMAGVVIEPLITPSPPFTCQPGRTEAKVAVKVVGLVTLVGARSSIVKANSVVELTLELVKNADG